MGSSVNRDGRRGNRTAPTSQPKVTEEVTLDTSYFVVSWSLSLRAKRILIDQQMCLLACGLFGRFLFYTVAMANVAAESNSTDPIVPGGPILKYCPALFG